MKYKVARPITEQPTDISYRLIPLTQGKVALVDADLFEALDQHSWFAWHCKGSTAWYACRTAKGRKRIYMHREVLGLKEGDLYQADHIDRRATLDNRRGNLRVATNAQNLRNRERTFRSPYRGIFWDNAKGKWHVSVKFNGKWVFRARFKDPVLAAKVYDVVAMHYDPVFTCPNFPVTSVLEIASTCPPGSDTIARLC